MKNSVWYHKLWKKKLDELPVDVDLNTAWSEMQSILDKNLPLGDLPKSKSFTKAIGSKIVSILGYILPAAAMISGVTYFALKQPKIEKQPIVKHADKNSIFKPVDSALSIDSLQNDSTILLKSGDSLTLFKPTNNKGERIVVADSSLNNGDYALIHPASRGISDNKNLPAMSDHLISSYITPVESLADIKLNGFSFANKKRSWHMGDQVVDITKKGKTKRIKPVREKKQREKIEIQTPPYNYGIEIGTNLYDSNKGVFLGFNGTYAITKRLLANAGLRFNIANVLEGSYTHPSYNLRDSAVKEDICIIDQRKLTTADIPLSLEYKISNVISVKAGPIISLLIKQGGTGSKLDKVNNRLDTVYNSKKIDDALNNSALNKVNIGFSGGVNIRIKQFNIEAGYRQNITPYKVSSDMGSYKKYFKTLQFGIGYSFK